MPAISTSAVSYCRILTFQAWVYSLLFNTVMRASVTRSSAGSMFFGNSHKSIVTNHYIWYDLREIIDPETALTSILTTLTDNKLPSIESEKEPFKFYLQFLSNFLSNDPVFIVFDNIDVGMKIEKEESMF